LIAKILQIVGALAILLALFIVIVVLYFLNKGLKGLNRTIESGKGAVRKDLASSIEGLETAQVQLGSVMSLTEGVKAGVSASLALSDRLLVFLRSRTFQVGVPLLFMLWILLLATPRALFRKRLRRRRKAIPPPSWQAAAKAAE
jgi:ABC-type multidrug transport system fused ATPase/permease subunit